jgi:pimeloyl-ACP methyl ester carboxylesterase
MPFLFQHGLGGDANQPMGLFRPPAGFRALGLDCRAHGLTRPLGPEDKIGIGSFADDLTAFMDHLEMERAIVGGISMGAAVALNLALRRPERVLGLVLVRPAWLAGPMKENAARFALVARLIREHGPERGCELFQQTGEYQELLRESPDCAASLVGQFQHPRAVETVVKLERIPRDSPCRDLAELAAIAVPTLVLANRQDPIHPYEYGVELGRRIAGAEFQEVTAKSVSVERYGQDVQNAVAGFLTQHFRAAT